MNSGGTIKQIQDQLDKVEELIKQLQALDIIKMTEKVSAIETKLEELKKSLIG